ncbi:restriction endonuclease subunit S [Maridesulfovibrio salexigens]|uniref:Restriction modification system DNA specificity domain protein n=1 Tax=Maridesulfovibrio salexigens (strain ATCC 14822 / DSM 2638 / NCIMB 8403 / VKM B-1763) TaxID=526222 RepID=C6BT24_MARSD|nr:restriction endonuclease subunit S [Maridesulfovibrio salexigens]ACS79728.1 restriction modification system DNA specificity domain protein [Maridesulfovibrio salexigens DSM 2638]
MSKELTQLASIHYGKSPSSTKAEESTIPIIGTGGQTGWGKDSLFEGPATVVGRKGTLGNPLYVETPFWPIDTTYAVLPYKNIHAKWLYYSLADCDLEKLNEATGVPSINRDYLGRIKISFVEFPQQRKIAKILTTVDNQIEKTEELIAKYESVKQGMMQDLFTRGVDENGKLRPKREDAPELYKKTELGWIPREWEVLPCIDVCTEIVVGIVIRPTQYYTSYGTPVLRSANVKEEGLDSSALIFMTEENNQKLSKSMVRAGDLVTVRTGYPGTTCVIPSDFDKANCVDIIISRPDNSISSIFLATWINSSFGKGQVLKRQGGLAQQHFNVGEMKDLLVVLPSQTEQDKITKRLNSLKKKLITEKKQLTKLKHLKTALMQDLLTGKIEVTPDPEDMKNTED